MRLASASARLLAPWSASTMLSTSWHSCPASMGSEAYSLASGLISGPARGTILSDAMPIRLSSSFLSSPQSLSMSCSFSCALAYSPVWNSF